jgi:hypothetical protein
MLHRTCYPQFGSSLVPLNSNKPITVDTDFGRLTLLNSVQKNQSDGSILIGQFEFNDIKDPANSRKNLVCDVKLKETNPGETIYPDDTTSIERQVEFSLTKEGTVFSNIFYVQNARSLGTYGTNLYELQEKYPELVDAIHDKVNSQNGLMDQIATAAIHSLFRSGKAGTLDSVNHELPSAKPDIFLKSAEV